MKSIFVKDNNYFILVFARWQQLVPNGEKQNLDNIQIWAAVEYNGNVILPEAKITPETLIFPEGC